MNIITKTICNIAVGSLIIFGLIACSSSPAPWTQVDDSPWGSKRTVEAENLSNDVASMSDPVLLAEPEPVVFPKTVIMEEPISAEAISQAQPEMITPVMVESAVIEPVVVESQSTEDELLGMPSSGYAVQVYAANGLKSIEKFKSMNNVYELKTVATNRSGSIVYVLVDIYSDRASANAAATDLASRTGVKPWVRSLAGLQKIIVR